jgi:hypothetical protein
MRRLSNTPYQVTVPDYREPISGVVNTAMAEGALVAYTRSGSPQDARVLIAATNGVRPAILEQQVMLDADWQLHMQKDPAYRVELRQPVPIGSTVTARFAHVAEFEGTDYFTGIDGDTAVDTPLTTAAGKFAVAVTAAASVQSEIVGYLNRKITPHESASFRWEIRFV